ncbi:hypothetical protein WN944_026638 [Citrus x changshan-huyou]|uniref:CCHC-type domain-containing protein n=1 Tax=Citrus x changshan-huyou TaxID=2935761 RepID=A0AAP0QDF9_9ROSI
MVNRRKKAKAWKSDIPKKIYDKMMKNLQIGSPNPVARASEWLYEVDHIHKTYIVDLEHHVYKSSWPITAGDEIFPPMMKRPPGRPKMNRRREADEVPAEKRRYRMQCKYCKEFGHNKRGCPINPLNANKSTRHYKSNLKGYMTRIRSATRGPSGTKKIISRLPANVQPDAPWLGVQGKKIMAACGITLREKHNGPKRSELKNIDKGKGPTFPPDMVRQ